MAEFVQGPCRGWTPIVRHDHRPSLGQRGWNSDDRARTLLHDHVERVVRRVLRGTVKKGLLPEHDQILLCGLQEQARGGSTDLLPRYCMMGLREHGGIMVHFVGASSKRHGLRLADGGGVVSANLLHGFGQFNLRKPRRQER